MKGPAVKRCILFVAHAHGEGDLRGVVTHHLDLLPLHGASVERRASHLGEVVAHALLVEHEDGKTQIVPARTDGISDREYKEFLASCEDWAKGR